MSDLHRRRATCATALGIIVLISALSLVACSGSSSTDSTATAGSYVAAKNLSQYKPGTPQRTVLQWWKAVQYSNPTVVHGYYAPGMGPRLHDLQGDLAAASNQFAGIPAFNSAEVRGDKATLYFFVIRPGSDTPPRPASINLVRNGGRWSLADNELLAQVVERVARASQRAAS